MFKKTIGDAEVFFCINKVLILTVLTKPPGRFFFSFFFFLSPSFAYYSVQLSTTTVYRTPNAYGYSLEKPNVTCENLTEIGCDYTHRYTNSLTKHTHPLTPETRWPGLSRRQPLRPDQKCARRGEEPAHPPRADFHPGQGIYIYIRTLSALFIPLFVRSLPVVCSFRGEKYLFRGYEQGSCVSQAGRLPSCVSCVVSVYFC